MATREVRKIKFTKRDKTGKGVCRKLRVAGTVPAVFYGPEYKESVVGSVVAREIAVVANSANWETNIIDLELDDGKTEMALLREVKRHAVTQNIQHVDLYQLVRGRKVRVNVPVRVINRDVCQGVKMGGVLDMPVREIEMMVLPREIPSELVVDAIKMQMGDEITVRDLELPESCELLVDEEDVVAIVSRPRSMVETEAGEGDEEAEVEVVSKGKRKEDDE